MKPVNRLRSFTQDLLELSKTFYILLGLPILIVMIFLFTSMTSSGRPGTGAIELKGFTLLLWAAFIIPIVIFIVRTIGRRKICKAIFNDLREGSIFDPDRANYTFHEAAGKFLGVDIKTGNILYIHKIRNGQVDVVGMNVGDWTHRETQGNMLRLYTKFPELPRLEIATHQAQRFFDTLGAMEHKRYEHSQPFSAYVNSRVEQLERDHNIHIPKLA